MNNAKYMTPSAATLNQSRPRGHLIRNASAIGSKQKPDANSEHPERDRIGGADRKPGGAARHSAKRARRDCRDHADIFFSESAHARPAVRPHRSRLNGTILPVSPRRSLPTYRLSGMTDSQRQIIVLP